MADITQILSAIEQGERQAAEQLLPLIYDELRKLAAAKLAREKPGQTLQATALVHEAYLRLVGGQESSPGELRAAPAWNSRGHFFAAAAEAMRRILTDAARRKQTVKHGGAERRIDADIELLARAALRDPAETLMVHELLDRFAAQHPRQAEVVKLRYFLGCTQPEAADVLGISSDAVQDDWVFARAWLKREWRKGEHDKA